MPGFMPHDAITNHVRQLRRVLDGAGFDSDTYAEVIGPGLAGEARPVAQSPGAGAGRILLYHASTHSPMASWLVEQAKRGATVLADYHNITPALYFRRWLPDAAAGMDAAREQLADLSSCVHFAFGDSAYNQAELVELGFKETATCPLLVDLDSYHRPPRRRTLSRLRRTAKGGTRWLFVGRIAPNKCQHDVVAAFALYRRAFDPKARLSLVGGVSAIRYLRAVQSMAAELGVADAVELVHDADQADLLAYFHASDVFVCLSEHEGFCVPILEAMELSLPVVAHAAAAVPETVGEAGVLLPGKDPLDVACAVADLLADTSQVAALVAAGRRRAEGFSLPKSSATWVAALEEAVASARR